jgi:hypothetical protein
MLPKERLQPLVDKRAIQTAARALKVVDAEMYITCLRFWVHQLSEESLAIGQYIARSQIFKDFPNLPRRWKKYFWAARRSLKTNKQTIAAMPGVTAEEPCWKLHRGWVRFLFDFTGLDLADPNEMQAFRRLNPYLCIDAATKGFAEGHPGVLERVRMSLRGSPPVSSRSRPRQPDTPLRPPPIDPDPALPSKDSQMERVLNMMKTPEHPAKHRPGQHIHGKMTKEEWERLPQEIKPTYHEEPQNDPPVTPAQPSRTHDWGHEAIARKLRGY